MKYWEECIRTAFNDCGIIATEEQIMEVVSCAEGCHENYSMAMGYDCIPNPLNVENKRLKNELSLEKEKIFCKECNGRGHITTYGGTFQSTSRCYKCNGEGKLKP